jgi:hypothetical protein
MEIVVPSLTSKIYASQNKPPELIPDKDSILNEAYQLYDNILKSLNQLEEEVLRGTSDGVEQLEHFLHFYTNEKRKFFDEVQAVVTPSDRRRVLRLVVPHYFGFGGWGLRFLSNF